VQLGEVEGGTLELKIEIRLGSAGQKVRGVAANDGGCNGLKPVGALNAIYGLSLSEAWCQDFQVANVIQCPPNEWLKTRIQDIVIVKPVKPGVLGKMGAIGRCTGRTPRIDEVS